MITTNYSIASQLSNIYQTNGQALSDTMSRIASGKRIQNPSDDFAGWLKANSFQTDVNNYTNVKQDIQAGKSLADYAVGVGNQIVEDITQMQTLATEYAATNDAQKQAAYKDQFTAIQSRVTDEATNAVYDSVSVYATGALKSVSVNGENAALVVNMTTTNSATPANLNNIQDTTGISNELTAAQTYLDEMTSFSTELANFSKIADTAVSSKQAAISAITDINEVVEMSNETNLQVRNQAAVSMMTQANVSQAQLARLFQ